MARRAAHVLWAVAVVLVPWPYGGAPEPLRYALAALAALVAALAGPELPPLALPLLALPIAQLAWSEARGETFDAGVLLVAYVAAAWGVRALLADEERRRRQLARAVVAAAGLQALFGVVQFVRAPATLYGARTPWITTPFGSFVNHNHFATLVTAGAFVALGLAAEAARERRSSSPATVAWAGAAMALVIALLASGSRGGLLALFAGALTVPFVAVRRRRMLMLGGVALAAAAIGLVSFVPTARARLASLSSGHDVSWQQRRDNAVATARTALARPVLGCGLGALPDAVTRYKRTQVRLEHADSDVLEYTAEAGLLGWLVLAACAGSLLRSVRSSAGLRPLALGALAAVVSIAAHSAFDHSVRLPAIAFVFVTLLAIATAPVAASAPRRRRWSTAVGCVVAVACAYRAVAARELEELRTLSPQRGVEAATRLVERAPWIAEGWRQRGAARVRLAGGPLREHQLALAEQDYERVLSRRPLWSRAWYERAWIEAARGRRESALAALTRAGELDPANAELAFARAALTRQLVGEDAALDVLAALATHATDVPVETIVARGRPWVPEDRLRKRLAAR